jgi:bifunctional non-homologous end joining protein LigD
LAVPGALVFFLFDLLHFDGEAIAPMPMTERKERLHELLSGAGSPLHFSDHQIGGGRAFYDGACALKVEGIVSKRVDAPYAPGNRGLWLKVKCLNREEFVVVGWTDPEGTRPFLGALAPRQPLRIAARLKPSPLGAARTGRGSEIPHLDRGQPAAPGRL